MRSGTVFMSLVEKPISVHKSDCEKLIAAHQTKEKKGQVFAAMFNQRTDPFYQKIRSLIQGGELGEIPPGQLDHHQLVSHRGLLHERRLAGDVGGARAAGCC